MIQAGHVNYIIGLARASALQLQLHLERLPGTSGHDDCNLPSCHRHCSFSPEPSLKRKHGRPYSCPHDAGHPCPHVQPDTSSKMGVSSTRLRKVHYNAKADTTEGQLAVLQEPENADLWVLTDLFTARTECLTTSGSSRSMTASDNGGRSVIFEFLHTLFLAGWMARGGRIPVHEPPPGATPTAGVYQTHELVRCELRHTYSTKETGSRKTCTSPDLQL